jgi:hypothetical protein
VPTSVESGRCVVSTKDPYGRILGFLGWSRYFLFRVAPQLYSQGLVDPVPGSLLLRIPGSARNRTRDIYIFIHTHTHKDNWIYIYINSVAWVHKRTIQTEWPTLVAKLVPTFADRGCYTHTHTRTYIYIHTQLSCLLNSIIILYFYSYLHSLLCYYIIYTYFILNVFLYIYIYIYIYICTHTHIHEIKVQYLQNYWILN